MFANDAMAYRQSQAGTLDVRFRGEKGLEKFINMIRLNAFAVIRNADAERVSRCCRFNEDRATLRACVDGIVYDVQDNLLDLVGDCNDVRHLVGVFFCNGDVFHVELVGTEQ